MEVKLVRIEKQLEELKLEFIISLTMCDIIDFSMIKAD